MVPFKANYIFYFIHVDIQNIYKVETSNIQNLDATTDLNILFQRFLGINQELQIYFIKKAGIASDQLTISDSKRNCSNWKHSRRTKEEKSNKLFNYYLQYCEKLIKLLTS